MFSKRNTRYDQLLNEFEKGMLFGSTSGKITDLSDLTVCNIAIDTVRQLYTGTIDKFLFQSLKHFTKEGSVLLDKDLVDASSHHVRYKPLNMPCQHMKLSRMGKTSGYRFKFQNNEIGLVVLLGSYYSEIDKDYSHLKIELSPHFIAQRTPEQVQDYINTVAELFLIEPKPSGVAPHICVDFQGWNIPHNFIDDVRTRSKFIKKYTGIGEVSINGLQDVISTFNRTETVMIGSPSAIQLSVYRKDLEIVKSDKVDYMHDVWLSHTLGSFDKEQPVIRVESRFHHSVINQFGQGINEEIKDYLTVSKYLNNLWKYSLNNIRYVDNNNVHPLWQFLHDDITFNDKNDIRQSEFKRQQVAKKDTTGIRKNIGLLIGNFLTIHARSGRSFSMLEKDIKNCPSLIDPIRDYLQENRLNESVFFQELKQKLLDRRIASKFAICA